MIHFKQASISLRIFAMYTFESEVNTILFITNCNQQANVKF